MRAESQRAVKISLTAVRTRNWKPRRLLAPNGDTLVGHFVLRLFSMPSRWCILVWVLGAFVLLAQTKNSPSDDLARQIIAAQSESSRSDLLTSHSDVPPFEVAASVIEAGRASRNHGDLTEALRILNIALQIAENSSSLSQKALALNNIGLVHYDWGDYSEALDWYGKSLAVSQSIQDEANTARTFNNMGAVYSDLGQFETAAEDYRKSLTIAEKIHNGRLIGNALANQAVIYGHLGDYARALTDLKRTYDISERLGDKRGVVIGLINMGSLFSWQGDVAQAEDYTQRAATLADAAGLKPLSAIASLNLGEAAQLRGDLGLAMTRFERSVAQFKELGDRSNLASALTLQGSTYAEQRNEARAMECFEESLNIRNAIGASRENAFTFSEIASLQNQLRHYEAAREAAEKGISIARNSGYREAAWRDHLQLGNAYRGLRQLSKAEGEFSASIATIEDLRPDVAGSESEQERFFEYKLEPYQRMIDLLATDSRSAEAFQYAERAKARVLIDTLRTGRIRVTELMNEDERKRDEGFRMKLASLNAKLNPDRQQSSSRGLVTPSESNKLIAELDHTRLEYAAYRTNLFAQHREWKLQIGGVDTITLAHAFELMPDEHTAMLEFVVTGDHVYLFALTRRSSDEKQNLSVYSIPIGSDDLSKQIQSFRSQLATRDLGFRSGARHLYSLLLGPAAVDLAGKRNLIIVPDGVLWELPFQALIKSDERYLLDWAAISYAPSLSAFEEMLKAKGQRRSSSASVDLVAMGNSNEVQDIAQVYGNNVRIYKGPEARESQFKAIGADAKVVHLAAHAIADNTSPLYSYLLMAKEDPASGDDGLLEAWELQRMNLRAELVVLSACETARGRVARGEGIIGLSWSLLLSGVPTTVLSQWKVESDSTSKLMVAFHRYRKSGLKDPEALRRAALDLKRNSTYAHPFYWAPFIVIGAGG